MTTQSIPGLPTQRPNPLDPPVEIGELRATGSMVRMTFPDGHLGWLATAHHAVRAVLASPAFSNRIELTHPVIPVKRLQAQSIADFKVPPGMFNRMDDPEHSRIRRTLTGQFTVRRMNLLEPRIEQIVREHLGAIVASGPPVDLVPTYTLPIPSLVICELLGVPYERRDQFQGDASTLLNLESGADEAMAAWASMYSLLGDVIAAKRERPADDLLSGLIAEGELTDEELCTIGLVLLIAGHETTANMLALGTYTILRQPGRREAFLADPATAVEELLRYLSIIHFGPVRTALEDVEIDGHLVKAGEAVAMSVPGANRDPAKFTNPDDLDLTRHAQGHLAFGHGIHQCLGQQLARVEMRIAFTALLSRLPTLKLAGDVRFRDKMSIYGLFNLPVTWDA
ncbi:cytochrome P450 [Kibdelosporangium persicum]|uniref:Cytochrome monooxygenase n=1 Tax=Kibdelosporangium persicum TaxID=2698649 RepID=A0ABX2F0R0_9PSEU|nr:cytochrome P450 [Kibdelosporangium persicum]NRN64885.1 Cytochrome monooxygenase [Kibdelosporangium persicum]